MNPSQCYRKRALTSGFIHQVWKFAATLLLSTSVLLLPACSDNAEPTAVCLKGFHKAQKGSYKKANELLTQCIESKTITPGDRRTAYMIRSMVNHHIGDYSAAANDLTEALRIENRNDPVELITYGEYLRDAGRLYDSLSILRSTQHKYPSGSYTARLQVDLGMTLYKLGKYDEAIKELNAAIVANQGHPGAYYYRGLSYEGLGRKDSARLDFAKAYMLIHKKNILFGSRV
jgi:tetratricopeptide (TPR) repeat protein